ncbi:MAG: ribbon-helix-helix protein, CopG family [Oscillospiraceae bacterium]|nr:ribbon-helix-helix protein, CopG family [Oscillospiraceae bacterium]
MFSEKRKFALWAQEETYDLIEAHYAADGCKSRSEFIERAVRFYAGYLQTDGNEFLPRALVSSMRGMLDTQEDRVCSLLFKLAVEMAMLMHVTAAANDVAPDTLARLRGRCVQEVKALRGKISFDDAVQFQQDDANG